MESNNMTREEAINKVRQMSLPKETMDILEELVPELAMSEDERMINELQGFLLSFGSDYFGTGEWQKFDDWLEKQKEQKLEVKDPFNDEQFRRGYESGYADAKREQKPAEWSEEDERILKGIIGLIDHDQHYGVSNNEMISWLKSLSLNLKKKNEDVAKLCSNKWSKQDEAMIKSILFVLESYVSQSESASSPSLITTYPTYYKEIDWLKSLRRSWKPSEEQMSMLLAVINEPNNAGSESCHIALKSLYNDLMKRM